MKKWIPILLALCLIFSLMTSMAACQRKGDKGDTGAMGPQGIQGPKGDKGDPGTSAVIDVIANTYSNGAYLEVPSLYNGMPNVKKGDFLGIYGTGFVVGETVTFTISNLDYSFPIGSTTVNNSLGVLVWDTLANWPSPIWLDSSHPYGVIKALGDKGSTVVSFVFIGHE